jgi:cell division septation protein DedD
MQTSTDKGKAEPGTRWAINLIALDSRTRTESLQQEYAARGVDAEVTRAGKLFALRIPGFSSRQEAAARAAAVKDMLGIGEVWIYEY